MRVYFNEYNVRMGELSYFPLVSGLLQSYAQTYTEIKNSFEFMPFIYAMDVPHKILEQYTKPPDIACFSSVMWNEQLNYHIAEEVKKRWPNCLIIFGGPNVPMPPQHSIIDWMMNHPYVDLAVRAEGEEPFVDILKMILSGKNRFDTIPSVAWNNQKGLITFFDEKREFEKSMDKFPSPYLYGLYDYLLESSKKTGNGFQAIIETNRGCPFPCTFCYWGRGGLSRKFRYKSLETVFAEIEWMGKNNIKYVFNADSNFGMNDRDHEIAEFIVQTKKKYGFPEKFRTCFGKNTDEKIFKIGSLFHSNQLEKGITLARQSNDLETLKNIRRNNIKMSTYVNLQKRFNELEIPIYGELILGLPGETKESWIRGVDELLEAGTKNQLFIYLCQVFSNTEMAETEYQEKYGIQTKSIKLAEMHCQPRPAEFVQEYENIIVSTNSMPLEDWKQSLRFSYILMLFHSLKMAYYIMIFLLDRYGIKMSEFMQYVSERKFYVFSQSILTKELNTYDSIINRMLDKGEDRGTLMPEYGDFYWDVEESSFLRITRNTELFYAELGTIICSLLKDKNIELSIEESNLICQVIDYQKNIIPTQHQVGTNLGDIVEIYDWNLSEYFSKKFSTNEVPLEKKQQEVIFHRKKYNDLPSFAKKTILWGRKSGTMLVENTYKNGEII